MNVFDLLVVLIFAICIIYGVYHGFVSQSIRVAGSFLAWGAAVLFRPLVSNFIMDQPGWYDTMLYVSDMGDRITNADYILADVSTLTPAQVSESIAKANPQIPDALMEPLYDNIVSQRFADQGITTLTEYFNHTMADMLVNVISFLTIFIAVWILCAFIISMLDNMKRLRMLSHFDAPLGGCFGVINAFILCMLIFSVVPVVISVLPISFVIDSLQESALGSLFYSVNLMGPSFVPY